MSSNAKAFCAHPIAFARSLAIANPSAWTFGFGSLGLSHTFLGHMVGGKKARSDGNVSAPEIVFRCCGSQPSPGDSPGLEESFRPSTGHFEQIRWSDDIGWWSDGWLRLLRVSWFIVSEFHFTFHFKWQYLTFCTCSQDALYEIFLLDGHLQKAFLFQYLPLFLSNAVNNTDLGLRSGLVFLVELYQTLLNHRCLGPKWSTIFWKKFTNSDATREAMKHHETSWTSSVKQQDSQDFGCKQKALTPRCLSHFAGPTVTVDIFSVAAVTTEVEDLRTLRLGNQDEPREESDSKLVAIKVNVWNELVLWSTMAFQTFSWFKPFQLKDCFNCWFEII